VIVNGSLFERMGGFARVRLLVSEFYGKVMDSDRLRPYFAGVEMRRLVDHQTRFVASMMGGPSSFSDAMLERAHAHLGIPPRDFDEMVALFQETLEDNGVSAPEVLRMVAHLESLRDAIVAGAPAPP
jgi:hemoglobin